MNLLGFTYEADFHCPDCTKARFGEFGMYDVVTDAEGNQIVAIYDIYEDATDLVCCDCL